MHLRGPYKLKGEEQWSLASQHGIQSPALTYFRVATIIGPGCLTAEFGMESGISSQVWAPDKIRNMLGEEDRVTIQK